MMKSCIMCSGWKTQSPLCAANKRMGATLSSKHLFMSDYANLDMRLFLFFSSHVAVALQISLVFSFGVWYERFGVQHWSHSHTVCVCHYCTSHCFYTKRLCSSAGTMTSLHYWKQEWKQKACRYLGMVILMILSIMRHFLYTHAHTTLTGQSADTHRYWITA